MFPGRFSGAPWVPLQGPRGCRGVQGFSRAVFLSIGCSPQRFGKAYESPGRFSLVLLGSLSGVPGVARGIRGAPGVATGGSGGALVAGVPWGGPGYSYMSLRRTYRADLDVLEPLPGGPGMSLCGPRVAPGASGGALGAPWGSSGGARAIAL